MKHKFFALCLTLVMAMSAVTFFSACGEEKTPSGDANVTGPSGSGQNPDEGNKNPDESGEGGQPAPEEEQATEGLHYTPIYGEDGTAIGYIVGVGEAAEEEKIVIPAKHEGLPVLRIGFPEEYFEPHYDGDYLMGYDLTDKGLEEYTAYVKGLGYDPQKLEGDKENEELYLKVLYSFYQQYTFTYSKAKTIEIPNGVTQIGINAFAACDIESLYLPESVTKVENTIQSPLVSCNKLTKIEVSEKNSVYCSEGNCLIETATKTVVAGCKASVIPEGMLTIGAGAFSGMEELEEINIPKSVISIQWYAFLQCFKLQRIVFGGTEEEWKNIDKMGDGSDIYNVSWRTLAPIEEVVCANGTLTGDDIG